MHQCRGCTLNTFVYVSGIENSKLKHSMSFEVLKLTNELGGEWHRECFPLALAGQGQAAPGSGNPLGKAQGRRQSTGILETHKLSYQQTQWRAGALRAWLSKAGGNSLPHRTRDPKWAQSCPVSSLPVVTSNAHGHTWDGDLPGRICNFSGQASLYTYIMTYTVHQGKWGSRRLNKLANIT